jgi:uncharacterized membrane protein
MPNVNVQLDVITGSDSTPVYPSVRKIGPAGLKDALAKGLADFLAKPSHLVFFGLIYPLVGIGLVVGASPLLIFPLLSGFALTGPFAGIGLYEISRARELGLDTSWKHAFAVVHSRAVFPILSLGLLLLVILALRGQSLYVSAWVQEAPQSFTQFINDYLRHAARLEVDRIRHPDRFCLCRACLDRERRLAPDASRPPN